jgi:catechol 2,3-dioxygenase-like lactoylglutathione lyase family enzyme
MLQLDHINIYVSDVNRSRAFYIATLGPFGYELNRDYGEYAVGLGRVNYAELALVRTTEAVQPIHLAYRVEDRAEVHRFYELAIRAGAKDNGLPGLRPDYHANYYAAFVRDPDGHNLEVVCHVEQA